MQRHLTRLGGSLLLALLLTTPAAWAWWPVGHGIIARAAVLSLPPEVPAFFRAGGDQVAHTSFDPDVAKIRTTPNVSDVEGPDHFIDLELLAGKPLPGKRYEFIALCAQEKLAPEKVGLVPYSTAEWTERLAIAFAEHRRWPENAFIKSKCLIYAGFLAHYAGDLTQPLHTTIHHDGRARPDGTTPRSGIHNRVDALIQRLNLAPAELARDQKIAPVEPLMPAITTELQQSHSLVERVYALEEQLPPTEGPISPSAEVVAFTKERARAATRFLATLYLTAWDTSRRIQLPPWLERETAAPAAR
jgi:hypothetical protein